MTLEEQLQSAKEKFNHVGCRLSSDSTTGIVTAKTARKEKSYRLPAMVPANQSRIPGWFLAGIWDDMGLPSVISSLDIYYLTGWGFIMPDQSRVWLKSLPHDENKLLIYHYGGFYVVDAERNASSANRLPRADDKVADLPEGSIYHVVKLFEEKGWFDEPETAMPSQNID